MYVGSTNVNLLQLKGSYLRSNVRANDIVFGACLGVTIKGVALQGIYLQMYPSSHCKSLSTS